jgi:hypothetical protein
MATYLLERCRSCGAPVAWGKTKNGKACPYNVVNGQPTEESHFRTCPQAKDWSKKVTKKEN